MNKEKILYNSDEAAKKVTLTGWVAGGRFFGNDEHLARYAGCSHNFCDCGNEKTKHYTSCDSCRFKLNRERYLALEYKEFNHDMVTCLFDGDKYFFSSEDIDFYIEDQLESDSEFCQIIYLLVCEPVGLGTIDCSIWADEQHEDWEPSKQLEQAIEVLNTVLKNEPNQSWKPSKIRTTYSNFEMLEGGKCS